MDGQLDQFVNELKRQLGQLDRRIRSLALLRGLGFVILVLICLVQTGQRCRLRVGCCVALRAVLEAVGGRLGVSRAVWCLGTSTGK